VKPEVGWALYVKEGKDVASVDATLAITDRCMKSACLCDEFHKPHKPSIGTMRGILKGPWKELGNDVGFLFPVFFIGVFLVSYGHSLLHTRVGESQYFCLMPYCSFCSYKHGILVLSNTLYRSSHQVHHAHKGINRFGVLENKIYTLQSNFVLCGSFGVGKERERERERKKKEKKNFV